MKEQLQRFLTTKRIEGCTEKTLSAYQYELDRFLEFFGGRLKEAAKPENLNRDIVEDWLASRALQGTTRARMLAALKSFSRFMVDRGVLETNPLDSLKTPRTKQKAISFLTAEEFQRLLADVRGSNPKRDLPGRDFAILALFVGSGIRISELRGLNIDDVDLRAKQIKITRKGGKGQYLPIGKAANDALTDWLEHRKLLVNDQKQRAFFVSNQRRRMGMQTIRNVVKKYMKRTGLWGKKMSPHTLRHTYATTQISLGTPVQVVQELLGHNQLNTTSKYLHIVNKERREAAEKIEF